MDYCANTIEILAEVANNLTSDASGVFRAAKRGLGRRSNESSPVGAQLRYVSPRSISRSLSNLDY
jgi:hypothetical protein